MSSPNIGFLQTLSKLEQVNNATTTLGDRFDETKMLLVTLSTVIMTAKGKRLDAKYYQWTRTFLKHVRGDEGQIMPNIEGILDEIDTFTWEHEIEKQTQEKQIVDTLDFSRIENVIEEPSVSDEDANAFEDALADVVSSTIRIQSHVEQKEQENSATSKQHDQHDRIDFDYEKLRNESSILD